MPQSMSYSQMFTYCLLLSISSPVLTIWLNFSNTRPYLRLVGLSEVLQMLGLLLPFGSTVALLVVYFEVRNRYGFRALWFLLLTIPPLFVSCLILFDPRPLP